MVVVDLLFPISIVSEETKLSLSIPTVFFDFLLADF